MERIYSNKTALVVIDLQNGIISMGRKLEPYSGEEVIVEKSSELAEACRKNNIPVFLVHVKPSRETALNPTAEMSMGVHDLPGDWRTLSIKLDQKKEIL